LEFPHRFGFIIVLIICFNFIFWWEIWCCPMWPLSNTVRRGC
jgi:hypothetical protein